MINGILNVYKEKGFTSHDVVAKLRWILKQKKIGHTGTLDPEATGVLPVCLGNGTKLCEMLSDKSKEYVAELLLGITTDTQDMTGTIITKKEVNITPLQAEQAILSFLGSYHQIPPMYSALKVNGKKLYELARAGIEIEREARPLVIEELEILELNLPIVKFRVACSKGTYIRTLCYDIGEKLGCGGTMNALIRTKASIFELKDAFTLSQIEEMNDGGALLQEIHSVDSVFLHLRKMSIKKEFRKFLDNGNSLFLNQLEIGECEILEEEEQVRIYDDYGNFCAIYVFDSIKNCMKPLKMFPQ
ncbi:MAG TPA: tRNA pseudouridine(55) synthase TruB [Lachnospiraceae bacterium]|nr:tRNA pseudouridine(55) synthase TruB [Lachnospiraceae bacterium]